MCRIHRYNGRCFCNNNGGKIVQLYSHTINCGIGKNHPFGNDITHDKKCKYCHSDESRAKEGEARERRDIEKEAGDREAEEMCRRERQRIKARQRELREKEERERIEERERKREEECERERNGKEETTDRELREKIGREKVTSEIPRSGRKEKSERSERSERRELVRRENVSRVGKVGRGEEREKNETTRSVKNERSERGERSERREQARRENMSRVGKVGKVGNAGRGRECGESIERNQSNARFMRRERRDKQVRWEERETASAALQAEIASSYQGIDY
ncbi:hypothetical protein BOTCAL_0211g00180 [Botryotinia calthae]|uniref:Uncharacterized protein n=1 Tax=Botryotinia calthae TaxID=38488 RepID=A0A4Y8D1G6_9HELO|nr:hypothetical protein BOTCAL_0211g00180 [Botryotinia calthae]